MKNETDILKDRISLLENRQAQELMLLKDNIHLSYQSLRPINLIKSTLNEVALSSDIKDGIFNNVIGLITGYLSKKVLFGASHNPIKRVVGTVLQFAIAQVVSKNAHTIKAIGEVLIRRIFENRQRRKQKTLIITEN
ncbi:hypothetical protein [Emticicia sp.]|uniref:hypothetical protein n=1 Tax=Emticicia sp. TaxID=1930953 RepID=UPI00375329F0